MKITESNSSKEWSFKIEITFKSVSISVKGCLEKKILKSNYDEADADTCMNEYSFDEYLDIKKINCMKDAITDLKTRIQKLNL
jgi:hypothetical protein